MCCRAIENHRDYDHYNLFRPCLFVLVGPINLVIVLHELELELISIQYQKPLLRGEVGAHEARKVENE